MKKIIKLEEKVISIYWSFEHQKWLIYVNDLLYIANDHHLLPKHLEIIDYTIIHKE